MENTLTMDEKVIGLVLTLVYVAIVIVSVHIGEFIKRGKK
jgi:hypothetical protein